MKILYIDIDSMNPNHLGCYGYRRTTSPAIDRIAAEGIRFDRAYVSDSPCGPSRAATFSGRFGIDNGVVTHLGRGTHLRDSQAFEPGEADRARHPMLAEHLNLGGLPPFTFSTFAERHRFWWFAAGWAGMFNRLPGRCGQERADEVNAAVLPWLRDHIHDDWFLHVHYWDPHRNYRCPPEYMDIVRDGPPPDWPDAETIGEQLQTRHGPFTPWGLYPWSRTELMPERLENRADFERFITGYDASTRFCDDHIGALVEVLVQAGVWDEVAVIVTSDHGDHLGAQGIYGDHVSVYDGTQRVPLILRVGPDFDGPAPDIAGGSHSDALVLGLDLAPTIAALAGLPVPEGWHGRSLMPQLGDPKAPGRDHLVMTHGLYCAQRAAFDGEWKLVRTYHPGLYPFPPTELFHMPSDPNETTDRAADHPDIVDRLSGLIDRFVDTHQMGEDPLQWVIEDGPFKHISLDEWNARLQAAGRPLISP